MLLIIKGNNPPDPHRFHIPQLVKHHVITVAIFKYLSYWPTKTDRRIIASLLPITSPAMEISPAINSSRFLLPNSDTQNILKAVVII